MCCAIAIGLDVNRDGRNDFKEEDHGFEILIQGYLVALLGVQDSMLREE